MTGRLKFSIPTALVLVCTGSIRADVALPPVFSEGMVLQAELAVPIFGTAADGERVTVEFTGQKKSAVAKDGKWKIILDPLKPGRLGELKITGNNSITIKNILVGEVWLASGQSNMKFPLARASDAQREIAKASFAEVRYFVTPSGPWVAATPKTAGDFSAVAYYFAVHLHQRLQRSVGIIDSSVSGAVAQQFISPQAIEALEKDPDVAHALNQHGEPLSDIFQQSVAPLASYAIRGALWCQGEGNRDYPITYRKLLTTLIAEWRQRWGCGDFPFLIVQLANYGERKVEPSEGKDCAIREVQLKTAQLVPHCALIVAIDLGLAKDVHYPNKKPVGDRAALAARALAYGERIEYSGPLFQSAEFKDGKALVSFTHVGGGLVEQGGKLSGFLLCGEDKRFVRAEAAIEGSKVVVQSPAVAKPIAVRYAWERNPECNLYNRQGLPASPFRSDEIVNYWTKDN
jgi:sialate O-acetylesterase